MLPIPSPSLCFSSFLPVQHTISGHALQYRSRKNAPAGCCVFSAGVAAAELHLYWAYDVVWRFALAAHCPGAGAAVSGGDGGAVRILAVHPHRQILLCRHACCHPVSLVWLLLSDAVPSASVRVRRALAGKAGKLPAAKMNELSLYPHSAASAAGADERSSPAGLYLPGKRGRVARHRPRLWRGLFCRHGLYRTGDGDGDRDHAPQMPHPAYKDHAGAAICAGRAGGAVFRALYQSDPPGSNCWPAT